MGKQYTGIDGALYLAGNKVAKVQSWTFSANAEALDSTTLGDFAREFVYGVQNFQGTATILYYESNAGVIDGAGLMNDVMRTTQTPTDSTHRLELRYENGSKSRAVGFDCLLNQVTVSAEAGGIVTAEITFTVTGPLKTASIVG